MLSFHLIDVKELGIVKNGVKIINSASFNVNKGQFVFLTGKSGSGKSVIIKSLYADVKISSGDVIVDSINVSKIQNKHITQLRRKFGIVFQNMELFMEKSVIENLKFYLKLTGWQCSKTINNKISDVLSKIKFNGSEKKKVYNLSKGEQQKLAVARSLLNDPLILLADEPTANLDKDSALEIFELFLDVNKYGTSVIFATHERSFYEKNTYKILQCNNGQISDYNQNMHIG